MKIKLITAFAMLLAYGCAATDQIDEPATQTESPVTLAEDKAVETSEGTARHLLFEFQILDGEKVVSQPKIQTVEGHPMNMNLNYNETENTSFDYAWSVEGQTVTLGVAIRGPQGNEDFQELKFELGERVEFETPDGRYVVNLKATEKI